MELRRLQLYAGIKPTVNLPINDVRGLGWKDKDNLIIETDLKNKKITIRRL